MVASSLSTIAQVLCHQSLPLNFARLVGEIDRFVESELNQQPKARWDRETTVCFDLPGTRILLDWTENPGYGLAGVLTLSAGPAATANRPAMRPPYHRLCKKLVQLVEQRVTSSGVLWRQLGCEMSAEWIELLVEALPDLSDLAPPDTAPDQPRLSIHAPAPRTLPAPQTMPAGFVQDGLCPRSLHDPDLVRIRSALYEVDPEPQLSNPMRLAVHAMNATLIMVWAPLGAVVMAHSVLKGEDMRLSAHLMVLAGLGSAALNGPGAQQMLNFLPML